MRQWAEAAIGRRQLAQTMRGLQACGFSALDVLVDADSAQQADRLLIGPTGVYAVAFRTVRGNAWRTGAPPHADDEIDVYARATHRLAALVESGLLTELRRARVGVRPLLTVIGPEPAPGTLLGAVPLVGPRSLGAHLLSAGQQLSMSQVDALTERAERWLFDLMPAGVRPRGSAAGRRGGSL